MFFEEGTVQTIPDYVCERWSRAEFWGKNGALDLFWVWYTTEYDEERPRDIALVSARLHYDAAREAYRNMRALSRWNIPRRLIWWGLCYRDACEARRFADAFWIHKNTEDRPTDDELRFLLDIYHHMGRQKRIKEIRAFAGEFTRAA